MENRKLEFVSGKDFLHLAGASYEIVDKFKRLIEIGFINIDNIKLITVNYRPIECNVEKGPVRIYCSDGLIIYLNLTAGYGGAGPHDLCKVLKLCNVPFNENDILAYQDAVDLRYCKREDIIYQFCEPNGNYEYSM